MSIERTRTFRTGDSLALRLPKEVGVSEGVELVIVRSGEVLTICPAKSSLTEMIETLERLRKASSVEGRDDQNIPERAGL